MRGNVNSPAVLGILVAGLIVIGRWKDSGAQPTEEATTAAIDAVRAGFAAAYAGGDVEGLLAYYDRDYVDVSTGVAVRGKEAMRDALARTFERFAGRLDIRPAEVLVNGTWAIERGIFAIHLVDRSTGVEHVSRRRYLEVLVRREDGRWYIFRDLDNEVPGGPAP